MAQNDTLAFFDFQTELPTIAEFPDDTDTDSLWINWDEDQITAAQARPSNWYLGLDFGSPDSIPPLDTNIVLVSASWLEGYDTTSSNWFISPAIEIIDDQATINWESAPFQGPRYMDGYSVKVLVGSSGYFDADVTTIFRAAEMTGWVGDNSSTDIDTFTFTNGYIHANGYTDSLYFLPPDSTFNQNTGLLEPHSISLAGFEGETIFLAFHHDSADDNVMMLDNILMTGTKAPISSNENIEALDVRFRTYPNPVRNYLNVMYKLDESRQVSIEIFDIKGQLIKATPYRQVGVGDYTERFDLRQLIPGTYSVVLTVDGQKISNKIIR